MIQHHPTTETLEAHASGALAAGARFVVGAHLDACAACRQEVVRLQGVAGALLAEAAPAELAPQALERAMAALDAPAAAEPRLSLDALIAKGVWIPFGPKLAIKRLSRFADPGERMVLIRAAGGQALPEHGHAGAERLVVLSGRFEDEAGAHEPGDLAERGPAHRHQPIAMRGETCLCLSATDAPLRLSGPARWVQPILGL